MVKKSYNTIFIIIFSSRPQTNFLKMNSKIFLAYYRDLWKYVPETMTGFHKCHSNISAYRFYPYLNLTLNKLLTSRFNDLYNLCLRPMRSLQGLTLYIELCFLSVTNTRMHSCMHARLSERWKSAIFCVWHHISVRTFSKCQRLKETFNSGAHS